MSWWSRLLGRSTARADDGEKPYKRWFGKAGEWTRTRDALSASVETDALVIRGSCPRCGHRMDDFVSLSPDWLRDLRPRADGEPIETVTACNCDDRHEGRPEDEHGCGAIAVLTVTLTAPAAAGRAAPLAARITGAREATARDRSWDEEAARWDQAMTERLSTTAERWAGTIAALFGVTGFSLVLTGDQVARAVTSKATWPWWVLGGVLTATALACLYGWLHREKGEPADRVMIWSCGVGTAAAATALAWGAIAGVPVDAGPTFGILAGVAVIFGLFATGSAGLAAQGSPKWVNYLTGNRMRRLRMESADHSARNLRRARIATVLAVGALVATLAVLWYAPAAAPEPQQVLVRVTNGAGPVCGRLEANSGRGLLISEKGAREPRRIPPEEIAGVETVARC